MRDPKTKKTTHVLLLHPLSLWQVLVENRLLESDSVTERSVVYFTRRQSVESLESVLPRWIPVSSSGVSIGNRPLIVPF
jgi:hypothetical protein